ncbi:site-2 protease family protein [Candidatus Saccharibacteria bacterium]|nr:site-2 protease family protein [Candidatus Saccharibacteria bacterium]
MTTHEATHAFVGYWLGDDTAKKMGRLTLNPLKHIDPILSLLLPLSLALIGAPVFGAARPVPYNPNNVRGGDWGAALIAIAGPFANFVLAFLSFGVLALVGDSSGQTIVGNFFATMTVINLGFFIFNLIPIPPLDGSRLLYALAPDFFRDWLLKAERYGIIIVFAIILIAGNQFDYFLSNAISFFIQLFSHIFAF